MQMETVPAAVAQTGGCASGFLFFRSSLSSWQSVMILRTHAGPNCYSEQMAFFPFSASSYLSCLVAEKGRNIDKMKVRLHLKPTYIESFVVSRNRY